MIELAKLTPEQFSLLLTNLQAELKENQAAKTKSRKKYKRVMNASRLFIYQDFPLK